MTRIFYDSYARFQSRIIHKWDKQGFKYNAGNVQILRFAWVAKKYWSNKNGERVAKVNRVNVNQIKLF